MTSRQLDEEAIFHVARRITDADARADYLEQVCGDNTALLARVQALLDVHEKEQDFLRSPSPESAPTLDSPTITEAPGTEIGRYRLMEQIGEGGMGVVFVAEQRQPLKRKVALKVIKPGMDSKAVIARFEAERQALALMDHANIARVLDAGTTESGRPYFVMELVHGIPITEYCDQGQLTIGERLTLFIDVCHAIQHAHQKGIIHRDIKPTNVLVTEQDGRALPKIIDFGVAKALGQRLTEGTIYTGFQAMVGTPLYMSPEQAALSNVDVDTRSDVYSLGVLLYELLTGTTPLDRKQFERAAYDEVRRLICEQEPSKPSTKITTLGEAAAAVSARRKTEPVKLVKLVRGDLDWIVLKSLDKDRTRRYETVSSFADDVGRFLKEQPVVACPPSSSYRLRKFIRRNRGPVVTGAVVAITLICGILGMSLLSVWALKERGQLRDVLIDQSLVHAMGCDKLAAEEALANAERAGAPQVWRYIVQGLLAHHQGRLQEAIPLLRQATEIAPDKVVAHAALACAYEDASLGSDYGLAIMKLEGKEARTDFDKLFKASARRSVSGKEAADTLVSLSERRPTWGLAHLMLANAEVEQAFETGKLEDAEEAITEAHRAKILLPNSPAVYATELLGSLAAAQFAPAGNKRRGEWLSAADEAAQTLSTRFPGYAPREMAAYYDLRHNDVDRAIVELQLACRSGAGDICESFLAAMLYRQRRFDEMRESGFGRPWALLETEEPKNVVAFCRERNKQPRIASVSRLWSQTALYVAGQPQEARGEWNQLLKQLVPSDELVAWNLQYPLKHFTGEWNQDKTLKTAVMSGSNVRVAMAHFCIGWKCLYFDGKREQARKHFQDCVDQNILRIDIHYWARAILKLLEDPTWPRWQGHK